MAIMDFNALSALDLSGSVSKKPVFKKDKVSGRYIQVGELDYLNWADCLNLLHVHGASRVQFGNVRSSQDHPLFLHGGGIPFVRVYVEIDGDRRELDFPVIDGSSDISMEKLTQSDVHNATQRAFVKCVAINWGLGLKLWQKEDRDVEQNRKPSDDLEYHSISAIKRRVEQFITGKLQEGMTMDDLLDKLQLSKSQYETAMRYFDGIAAFEFRLSRL